MEENKDDISDTSREKLRVVVGRIRKLLEDLLEVESESQRKLGIAKDLVEEQIGHVSVAPKVMRSYQGQSESKPRFMDETG